MSTASPIEVGPAPVPPSAREVLVFGGTFDPPHRAHVDLPLAAMERLGADWLLYVPAARSPHKSSGPEASDEDRLAMLRAALARREQVSISTLEMERDGGGPSYTVDTLRALRVLLPEGARMRLLIGADQAAAFHRWRMPEEIAALAEPVVMLRPPIESEEGLIRSMRPHWRSGELEAWRRRIVAVPMMDISATELRNRLRARKDCRELGDALPPGVGRLIDERALYRGE